MVNLSEVYVIRYKRFTRRAVFAATAAMICGVLSALLQVPDFWMAGAAFLVGAWAWGTVGLSSRRMALRLRESDRQASVRALKP